MIDAMVGYFPEQAELMLKNTYPMWSKLLSNDEWLAIIGEGRSTCNDGCIPAGPARNRRNRWPMMTA
jgi:hypothetical protein